jgi:hypothetical protein
VVTIRSDPEPAAESGAESGAFIAPDRIRGADMSDDLDDIPESDVPVDELAGDDPDLDEDTEADIELEGDDVAEPTGDGDGAGSPPEEIPSGVKPASDEEEEEDDDDDDDEVEADLDTILRERLASDAEDEDEEEDEDGPPATTNKVKSPAKAEDEIMCDGCFLLVNESQFDTRGPDPACPHCGTPMNV